MINTKKHVAYVVLKGDVELEKKVIIKKSEITRMDDKCKLAKATTLYETNETNLATLASHDITVDTQTAFKAKIDAFENVIPKSKVITTSGSTSLEVFESLVKETNAFLLNKVDKIVDGADENKSEFITKYFKNREHVDLPSSTTSLKGKVIEQAGLLIKGVNISNGYLKFKTTKLGNFAKLIKMLEFANSCMKYQDSNQSMRPLQLVWLGKISLYWWSLKRHNIVLVLDKLKEVVFISSFYADY